MRKYDIAAFVWPSYTGDELRSRMFWPKGEGEWQTVRTAEAKFEGHVSMPLAILVSSKIPIACDMFNLLPP